MEALPTEIITEIFKHLLKSHLKSVAAVSQRLCDISRHILFTVLSVRFTYRSLYRLIRISDHPRLRASVRQIVYHGPFGTQVEGEYPADPSSFRRSGLVPGETILLLSTALGRMPHLNSVIFESYSSGDYCECTGWERHAPATLTKQTPLGFSSASDLVAISFQAPSYSEYPPGSSKPKILRSHPYFAYIYSSGSSPTCGVEALADPQFFRNPPGQARMGSVCRLEQRTFDTNIRPVSIELSFRKAKFLGRRSRLKSNAAGVLAKAQDLEELTICFHGKMDDTPLEDIFEHRTWPRLRYLRLMDKSIFYNELMEFLKRHGKSLRELHLQSILLCEGTWEDAGRELKSSLTLSRLSFDRLKESWLMGAVVSANSLYGDLLGFDVVCFCEAFAPAKCPFHKIPGDTRPYPFDYWRFC